jgi:pyruvate-formate lyase
MELHPECTALTSTLQAACLRQMGTSLSNIHCFHALMKAVSFRSSLLTTISQYINRRSVVGIATGYGLDDRGVGVRVMVGLKIFTSPSRPDRLWGPPNPLFNGYRELFPRGKAAGE